MGLIINNQEVTRIELGGVEVTKIEDSQGNVLYEAGPKYFCLTSNQDGSYVYAQGRSGVSLECSTDKQTWTPWDWEAATYLDEGDKLYLRGTNTTLSDSSNSWYFRMSGSIAASGDITTMLDPDGSVASLPAYSFYRLFNNCPSLTTAPSMKSVTTIGNYACDAMFTECTALATLPDLDNVTTVGQWGMAGMFEGCTSLTTAPDLRNITSVGSYGCAAMYHSCSSLLTIYAPSVSSWNTTNFNGWAGSVGSGGTMWKPSALTIPTGNNGVPAGWTTQDYE